MQEVRMAASRMLLWPGIHTEVGENARVLVPGVARAFVLTDRPCLPIAQRVVMSLQQANFKVGGGAVPAGKGPAKPATMKDLEGRLARLGSGPACIVAVGGSSLLHVAARLSGQRPWIAIPTTLRAQFDGSVGGSACPQPGGGWRTPALVLSDPTLPAGLPLRDYISGLADAVKCGVVQDPDFFEFLESNAEAIRARKAEVLEELVARAARVKAAAVDSPSPGSGARATLRYGHFVAGALERLAGAAILHGEALAVGMEAEMKISRSLGWADEETAKAQNRLIKALGLPTRAKGVPADRLAAPLLAAKLPGLDLPDELGHARGPAPLTQDLVRAAVAAVTK